MRTTWTRCVCVCRVGVWDKSEPSFEQAALYVLLLRFSATRELLYAPSTWGRLLRWVCGPGCPPEMRQQRQVAQSRPDLPPQDAREHLAGLARVEGGFKVRKVVTVDRLLGLALQESCCTMEPPTAGTGRRRLQLPLSRSASRSPSRVGGL